MPALAVLVVSAVGLTLGSFIGAYGYRFPRGISIAGGWSLCPECGHLLGVRDLVPVLSFVLLRGKCRFCGGRISWRYPLIEIVAAVGPVGLFLHYGLTVEWLQVAALFLVGLSITVIDWEAFLIPDGALGVGAVCGIGVTAARSLRGVPEVVLSAVVCALLLLGVMALGNWLFRRQSMGFGDVKLAGMIGLYLSVPLFLVSVWLAAVLGLVYVAVRRMFSNPPPDRRLPFGSFLCVSSFGVLLFKDQIQSLLDQWLTLAP